MHRPTSCSHGSRSPVCKQLHIINHRLLRAIKGENIKIEYLKVEKNKLLGDEVIANAIIACLHV